MNRLRPFLVMISIIYFSAGSLQAQTIIFTDGSSYPTSVTCGSTNQPLGRFRLHTVTGVPQYLTAASIKLNGTRTGLSNLKLWVSTDATFGSDTQIGSTVSSDPGDGNSASFSGFSSRFLPAGRYYFLTGDIDAGATGKVQGVVVANSSLTITAPGSIVTTIDNAPLSNGDASLPVGLVSFSARAEGRSIVLNWKTESEVENLGFILELSEVNGAWIQIASYQTHDALKGRGNTSSRTEYSFKDGNVESGKDYSYRLSDVSTQGKITVHSPLSIKMDELPKTTKMEKAYPNPFNPQTFISYRLSEETRVEISVFDLRGRRVNVLYSGRQTAGSYHVYWNGTDDNGLKAPSGGYIIRMETEETAQAQRVLMLK
jgi:hypothetical protein